MSAPYVAAVATANGLRAAGRTLRHGPVATRLAVLATLGATLGVSLLAAWATSASVATAASVLRQLPGVHAPNLVARLLAGALAGAFGLLLLGSLTTAVSTLFLSDELLALSALPVSARRLFARQLTATALAAAAPTFLVAVPALLAGSRFAPRPALAAAALGALLLALALFATVAGAALALALVRFVPPRRARFAAAFLSAAGLSLALVGFRAARPERLLDAAAALELLEEIGTTPPPPPTNPVAWAARAATRALEGDARGLAEAGLLLAAALGVAAATVALLAPLHRRAWETSRETSAPVRRRRRGGAARSAAGELRRAEARTLLRDASTPAQLGTLAAVAALYLLNLRLLPSGDAASRDLLLGVQTALALFLVGALALRFGYPAVSSDGRSALLLRSLPLDAARHLAIRWGVRAAPALALGLLLVGASAFALRPAPAALARALAAAAAGGLAIPALHVGLGALRPRYDAENPIAVALGPGGLLAISLTTAIAAAAAPVVSRELALLLSTLLKAALPPARLLTAWLALTLLGGVLALRAAARALARADVSAS